MSLWTSHRAGPLLVTNEKGRQMTVFASIHMDTSGTQQTLSMTLKEACWWR